MEQMSQMLKMREFDERVSFESQLHEGSEGPVVLGIIFTMAPEDVEAYKVAWAKDAAFTKRQPGFISAQLHQGIGGSTTFLDYAVFESVAAFEAMTHQPEFGPLREIYPDSVTASLLLFERLAIPGICLGEFSAT